MAESCVVLELPDTSPTFTLDLPRASIVVVGLTCTSVEEFCDEEPDCCVVEPLCDGVVVEPAEAPPDAEPMPLVLPLLDD
jgi:hypothetical protein